MRSNAVQEHAPLSMTAVFMKEVREEAPWLTSDWGAHVLVANFGKNIEYRLDFSTEAFAGNFSNTQAHQKLICDIYDFLCIHGHRSASNSKHRSLSAHQKYFSDSLYIVDFFLLNAQQVGLYDHGFGAIGAVHLKRMLASRASASDLLTGLMQWPFRLGDFLRKKAEEVTDEQEHSLLQECPDLSELDVHEDERSLGLTNSQLVKARCWLWANEYYSIAHGRDYKYAPNTSRLGREVYKGTLWVCRDEVKKTVFTELCVGPYERLTRECPGVPVKSAVEDEACSERVYHRFKSTLLTAKLLANVGYGFPLDSIQEVESFELPDAVRLKPEGRYVSAPPSYVLDTCGKAIAFFFEHGKHLLSSYANVVIAAKKASCSLREFASSEQFKKCLHPKTRDLGVRYWSISDELNTERLFQHRVEQGKAPFAEFFTRFRANEGLRELLQALYGAMQLIVGVLMAARQGELLDLPVDCLDETREWMTIISRKTGFDGLRHEHERPVPYIATLIVRRIAALHRLLRKNGVATPKLLFASPNIFGKFSVCHKLYNNAIDRFIDYIEAPRNKEGRRYYLRQHQLRRFFALLFYLSPYYGTLEDLQWMLRHIDSRHLEHYITQAIPGEQLASIRAEAFSIVLRENEEKLSDLSAFVKKHFGAKTVDLMTDSGFSEYVSYLKLKQLDGSVVANPVMYETPTGARHNIALVIFED